MVFLIGALSISLAQDIPIRESAAPGALPSITEHPAWWDLMKSQNHRSNNNPDEETLDEGLVGSCQEFASKQDLDLRDSLLSFLKEILQKRSSVKISTVVAAIKTRIQTFGVESADVDLAVHADDPALWVLIGAALNREGISSDLKKKIITNLGYRARTYGASSQTAMDILTARATELLSSLPAQADLIEAKDLVNSLMVASESANPRIAESARALLALGINWAESSSSFQNFKERITEVIESPRAKMNFLCDSELYAWLKISDPRDQIPILEELLNRTLHSPGGCLGHIYQLTQEEREGVLDILLSLNADEKNRFIPLYLTNPYFDFAPRSQAIIEKILATLGKTKDECNSELWVNLLSSLYDTVVWRSHIREHYRELRLALKLLKSPPPLHYSLEPIYVGLVDHLAYAMTNDEIQLTPELILAVSKILAGYPAGASKLVPLLLALQDVPVVLTPAQKNELRLIAQEMQRNPELTQWPTLVEFWEKKTN